MPQQSKIVDKITHYRWLNHLLFWIIITVVTAYHGSLFGGSLALNMANMVTILPMQMLAAYLMVYILLPNWLFRGEWLKFLLLFILFSYVMVVASRASIIYIAEPFIRGDVQAETLWQIISDPIYLLKVYLPSLYLPTVVLFLIKMTKERYDFRNREEQLIREKQAAELNFLKAQMNPHMLFNTLNNIYSLAKKGSKDTPEMILKLSEILDYTLYECNENRVNILKEWELIENYADLEALRYGSKLDIVLLQEIDDEDVKVAPLILISLVENAFKYGLEHGITQPNIQVKLVVDNGQLTFTVSNSKLDQPNMNNSKGIGVANIHKQLNLQYPNLHKIKVKDTNDAYTVTLIIQL